MTLRFDGEWIISDSCKQVAKAEPGGRWVLSWLSGTFDREQAIALMTRAENGDLDADPEQPPPHADDPSSPTPMAERQEPEGNPR
ncbi:hypothetical protein ACIBHY_52410 [Nonomuraea sp. NPDC050547]|uniref:hypothetical protein n=1 Tax=unclassified Nonomuraea TaxID=2593643 RepID=UPI0037B6F2D5